MSVDEKKLYSDLVNDICASEQPQYDNLIKFVHHILNRKVKKWCSGDRVLRGGLHDDDVMQEVQIKIIKKCEDYFFKPIDGKTEKTCDEFKAWCTRVAKNHFVTYCVRQKKRKEVELNLSIKVDDKNKDLVKEDDFKKEEIISGNQKRLGDCFAVVMDLKSSPHIILTWLSVSLFMIEYDMSKIESTHFLTKKFSEMPLYEMFDIITCLLSKLDWIEVDDVQINKQKQKLDSVDKGTGKAVGDMKYSEFYMSKGPEMSISDWVNRVNSQVRKHIGAD